MLEGSEWQATRPVICRTLGFSASPGPVLAALTTELDSTYRAVLARLQDNPAVRFEIVAGKQDLVLSRLEKTDEPASLAELRDKVLGMLPRVDLPELLVRTTHS